MQMANFSKIDLIDCIRAFNAEKLENLNHEKFKKAHIHGEWFLLNGKEIAEIFDEKIIRKYAK